MEILAAVEGVEDVYLNKGPGKELIYALKPDALVVGDDWLRRDYLSQLDIDEYDTAGLGLHVVFVPRTQGVSSTEIRERLP